MKAKIAKIILDLKRLTTQKTVIKITFKKAGGVDSFYKLRVQTHVSI